MISAMKLAFQGIGLSIRDLFFPPQCLHCQGVLHISSKGFLCDRCSLKIQSIPEGIARKEILDRLEPSYIDDILIAFRYDDIVQSVIHHIKYNKMPNLGIKIGKMAGIQLKKHFNSTEEKGFLAVPLHSMRLREREYNQSSFIGKGLIQVTGGNQYEDVLLRRKYTKSQTTLDREDRISNVRDAFRMGVWSGKLPDTIYLIDDLITTGATMNECARILKEDGITKVIGLAIASPL
jgi:ComF family protein